MKKLTYLLTTMLLLLLCGCSGDGITDTYWRDDKTGDWLIGLTEDKIIYDCKVWCISSMDESEGKYIIHAKCGSENLDISMGSEQDGKRTITIGGRPFDCSIISGWHLPDYPEKDTCSTIADNHYAEGDSVTIINSDHTTGDGSALGQRRKGAANIGDCRHLCFGNRGVESARSLCS